MIYISSTASSKDKIKDVLLELAQLGFRDIELGGGTNFYEGVENDLLNLKERYRINFLIHNYFPPPQKQFVMNIASRDRFVRDNTFKLIKNAIRLIKRLKLNLYTFHSGYNKSLLFEKNGRFYEEIDSKKNQDGQNTRKDFYQAIDFLLEYIIRQNLKIAIENLFPLNDGVYSFLDSSDDIIEFLSFYKEEPNIGLLLDLGHLNITSKCLGFDKFDVLEEMFANYPDKIFEIHISENDGNDDAHKISNLDSWQIELLRQNKKVLRDIPVVFEWRKVANSQTYQHFEVLKRFIKEMFKI